jgi:peptidoglycan/LPS O-acetylase OafA/YrhL
MKIYDAKGLLISNSRLPVFLEECGSGVSIFFFISGFILAVPFLNARVYHKNKISLKHYYYRRLTRIEPPYLISLTFFFLIIVCLLGQPFTDSARHYIASALYIHNITYDHISTINPVAWSLEIEIQFYLVFPLLSAVFFLKNSLARKICLYALFILSGTLYAENSSFFDQYHFDKSLVGYLSIFTAGMITADLYLENIAFLSGKKNLLFDIAALTALFYMITLSGFQSLGYRLIVFCCYLILFTGLFKGKILNLVVTNKIITVIGGMCYSIYLIHYAVIYVVSEYFTKSLLQYNYNTDLLIEATILLPSILIASAIFFILFERPFMNINWPQRVKHYFKK